MAKRKPLPEPLPFACPMYHDSKLRCALQHIFTYCKIVKIVTINDDHTLSEDCGLPQADCWFHVWGQCAYSKGFGESLQLVVTERDGCLVFYPLRNGRAHGDTTTKRRTREGHYIDLRDLSKLDEDLIRRTISNYLSGGGDAGRESS
jgi:hypothetical protein